MPKQYWNEEIETMSPDMLQRVEAERLQRQIAYVYNNSPWYKYRFDEACIFNYGIYAGGVLGQASFERLGATQHKTRRVYRVYAGIIPNDRVNQK